MKSTISRVAGRARPRRKLTRLPRSHSRLSSATSRRRSRTCCDCVGPSCSALAAVTSARRTHCRNVSGEVTPSNGAIRWIAPHSDSVDARSATIRTARAFNSTGYRFDVFPGITPTFPRFRVSGHTGAVHHSDRQLDNRREPKEQSRYRDLTIFVTAVGQRRPC